jgi:hypothetical protein
VQPDRLVQARAVEEPHAQEHAPEPLPLPEDDLDRPVDLGLVEAAIADEDVAQVLAAHVARAVDHLAVHESQIPPVAAVAEMEVPRARVPVDLAQEAEHRVRIGGRRRQEGFEGDRLVVRGIDPEVDVQDQGAEVHGLVTAPGGRGRDRRGHRGQAHREPRARLLLLVFAERLAELRRGLVALGHVPGQRLLEDG